MIRILLADDQKSALEHLESCFSDSERYTIVSSMTGASLLLPSCELLKPDVVFLDIKTREKDTNGLDMAQKLREKYPQIKIVMVTGFEEVGWLQRTKDLGLEGYIDKGTVKRDFVAALERIMAGERVFPDEAPRIPVLGGELPLTDREIEVLRLICRGLDNSAIGEALFIANATVKRHIESLMQKTGQANRVALAAYATSGGWIDPNI